MYQITAFGTVTLPTRQINQYIGAGQAANVYTPLPDGGLYDGLGASTGNSQGVDIPVNGMVSMTDYATQLLLDNYIDTLRSLVGQKGTLYRTSANMSGSTWTNARVESVNITRGEANYNYINAEMNFKQLSPAWYGGTIVTRAWGCGTAVSGTIDAFYQGNRVNTYTICTFIAGTAGHGTVTFTNNTTGHYVTYNGSVPAGGTLIINTQTYSVTKNGTADYAHLTYNPVKQYWMMAQPGVGNNVMQGSQSNVDGSAIFRTEIYDAYA